MSIDQDRLDQLLDMATADLGAIAYGPLAVLGDRLGLYEGIAHHGPLTPGQLSDHTDTNRRYVREWLAASAASGYVNYDPETGRYSLTPEQTLLLADPDGSGSPLAGDFQFGVAITKSLAKVERAFRTGEGVGWDAHDEAIFDGMTRAGRFTFEEHLIADWIPALEGIETALQSGARVADIGCGQGASTIVMAEAYPNSTFFGFDYYQGAIDTAREAAIAAGVSDQVSFEVAPATEFGGGEYDLVTAFDCLHDMGDPVGVAANVLASLADSGVWMIVEPLAGDRVGENLNPRGRLYYSYSTMLCTPSAVEQAGPHSLGAQAGQARLCEVVTDGGFATCHRVTTTPPKMVLEAKP